MMAYISFAEPMTAPSVRAAAPVSFAPVAAPAFSALEWSVIALAKRDSLRSLSQPGRLARAMGGLFGRGAASVLADPRLEALRRLAVHAWHHDFALPADEVAAFLEAGFTNAQVEALVTSVSGLALRPTALAA